MRHCRASRCSLQRLHLRLHTAAIRLLPAMVAQRPASSQFGRYPPLAASSTTQHHDARRLKEATSDHTSSDVALRREVEKQTSAQSASLSRTSSTAVSSSDDEEAFQEAYDDDAQLSPFHHLTLLLVRFACTSFPHLVPRVLFAEETIGPLVRWRTGGGAAGIVREFTSEQGSTGTSPNTRSHKDAPTRQDPLSKAAGTLSPSDRGKSKPYAHRTNTRPGFRAFWIGADATSLSKLDALTHRPNLLQRCFTCTVWLLTWFGCILRRGAHSDNHQSMRRRGPRERRSLRCGRVRSRPNITLSWSLAAVPSLLCASYRGRGHRSCVYYYCG